MTDTVRVGFVGAGAMARCHAFALSALPYYYDDAPEVVPLLVSSGHEEGAQAFARQFRFARAVATEEVWSNPDLDTLFVLGPNRLHFEHCRRALAMPGLRRLYLEKPACVTPDEASEMGRWTHTRPEIRLFVGYQLLQASSVRRALEEWHSGALGAPLHFQLSLLHSGYLDPAYRARRGARLHPRPEGGALVDLGSHLLSLAVAFLGPALTAVAAHALSPFPDVDPRSDLHTLAVLRDQATGALGTLVASRVAAGHEERMELQFSGTSGAVRVSSRRPDTVDICTAASRDDWRSVRCASDYGSASRFPARGAAEGWLRPLLHAHHLFLTDDPSEQLVPDLEHALVVQRLIGESVDRLGGGD